MMGFSKYVLGYRGREEILDDTSGRLPKKSKGKSKRERFAHWRIFLEWLSNFLHPNHVGKVDKSIPSSR